MTQARLSSAVLPDPEGLGMVITTPTSISISTAKELILDQSSASKLRSKQRCESYIRGERSMKVLHVALAVSLLLIGSVAVAAQQKVDSGTAQPSQMQATP